MSASAPGATSDYSKGPRAHRPDFLAPRRLLAALAIAGALLLALAEFTTLYRVVIGSLDTVRRSARTGSNHGFALLFVAIAVVPFAVVAVRGVRVAAVALLAIGAVALIVALAIDLPATRASGRLPESVAFEDARAQAGAGLYLELAGALLVLAAGAGLLVLRERRAIA